MDVRLLIRQRLEELGLEQKDLAAAAEVTESYISQLLTRKKMPPAPDRTDIYDKMSRLLKLPPGKLAKLADLQRKDELKRALERPSRALVQGGSRTDPREVLTRRERDRSARSSRSSPSASSNASSRRSSWTWSREWPRKSWRTKTGSTWWLDSAGRSYEDMRVIVLEFLDTDIFNVSVENCVSFLDPLIESWDIDLATFGMEIVLNRRLAPGALQEVRVRRKGADQPLEEEPGLKEFLRDPQLSGDAAQEEIEFLRGLRFKGKRPTSLYYYRELQNLRDPLHFRGPRPGERDPRRLSARVHVLAAPPAPDPGGGLRRGHRALQRSLDVRRPRSAQDLSGRRGGAIRGAGITATPRGEGERPRVSRGSSRRRPDPRGQRPTNVDSGAVHRGGHARRAWGPRPLHGGASGNIGSVLSRRRPRATAARRATPPLPAPGG